MELDPEEWIQLQYIKGNLLEPKTLDRIEAILNQGDVYIDVGSHVGLECCLARERIGRQGLVIAIEPQPYNVARILDNFRWNNFTNIKLYPAAAGDQRGVAWLGEQDPSDRALLSLQHKSKKSLALEFMVPIVTLKDVIIENNLKKIKLLKIDVEGFELSVLRGLGTFIDIVDNIIFEDLSQEEILDSKLKSTAVNYLKKHGFEIVTVEGIAWDEGMDIPENNLWARK
ncbi:MAG: FkbM family methyltransferase [Gammaproteobacteria bacterium]|nr:FkbM family methyltransferase [Gammaproteobacteria bacterium]